MALSVAEIAYLSIMRLIIALLAFATPAAAWEFSADPVCTLTDETAEASLTVTYDPSLPEYAIAITLPEGTWPDAQTFGMAFAGGRDISIQTDRHRLSNDGRTLTVTDRGFGNVLNGLEFNTRAYAILGDVTVGFTLEGIDPAITAFRACPAVNMA